MQAGSGFDLILCGHINLLPLAVLARSISGGRFQPSSLLRRPQPRPPIVLVVHGVEAWRPCGRRWSDFLLGQVDAVVAVSELTRDRFLGWSLLDNKPSFVLPNCVDLDVFSPGPRKADLVRRYQLGRPVLMTMGRLSAAERYKGVDELLELMPALTAQLPGLTYLIAGDGDDRARLAAKARSLKLAVSEPPVFARKPASVVFTGYVSEQEKADHYRLADTFVMAGRGEGFGIVYLEALACGVPVVASKADASREVLESCASAFLADPNNPDDVWNCIGAALTAQHQASQEWIRSFSRANFTTQALELFDCLRAFSLGASVVNHPIEQRGVFGIQANPRRERRGLRAAGI
ncbi:MAG TPA: glycosyltransferase family 4 protein [Verrucomicrobiae bacterium]|nr:glycosyltransferase family 4 protein [Verrucomicrobiae bacterium]